MILITEPSQGALLSEVTPPLRLPKKKEKKKEKETSASDWEQEPGRCPQRGWIDPSACSGAPSMRQPREWIRNPVWRLRGVSSP